MLIVLIKCFNVLPVFFSIKKMLSNSEERNLKYIKKLNIYFFFFSQSAWNDIGLSVDRTLYSNNDLF